MLVFTVIQVSSEYRMTVLVSKSIGHSIPIFAYVSRSTKISL